MKYPKQNYIIIVILSLISLIALTGVYYFSTRINDTPSDIQSKNSFFLDKIGAYILVTADTEMSEANCSTIEKNPDTASTGLTGEICERSMGAEYKDPASGHVVFVHLISITKNPELFRALLGKISKNDRLEPFSIFRMEGSEIGWFPSKNFDIIITQEGDLTPTGFDYALKALGKNAVTQYFISTYSPVAN